MSNPAEGRNCFSHIPEMFEMFVYSYAKLKICKRAFDTRTNCILLYFYTVAKMGTLRELKIQSNFAQR